MSRLQERARRTSGRRSWVHCPQVKSAGGAQCSCFHTQLTIRWCVRAATFQEDEESAGHEPIKFSTRTQHLRLEHSKQSREQAFHPDPCTQDAPTTKRPITLPRFGTYCCLGRHFLLQKRTLLQRKRQILQVQKKFDSETIYSLWKVLFILLWCLFSV